MSLCIEMSRCFSRTNTYTWKCLVKQLYIEHMKYKLLCENPDADIITRLMKVRNIEDDLERFLDPSYQEYRQSPSLLSDIDIAIQRIEKAIKNKEKIMIFGDYDVDGIMSSYVMYTFFTKFLHYKDISIRLPHRTRDWYGLKTKHIDEIHELWCTLIITVDNGITSFAEAEHARELGIDLIITDHHQVIGKKPAATAVVNPQTSPDLPFKDICGATVAFKVCLALADKMITDRTMKKHMYEQLLPFVSIATIADCMPLIDENRLIVKKGFELMNERRHMIAPSLKGFLERLNIKNIDSYHVGFMIGPRLNATGRIDDAMEWLMSLLISHPGKQRQQLEKIDLLNNERRKMQQQMVVEANTLIDHEKILMVASSESFHEGIVGIVAGRITEKHNKPSLILRIDSYKKTATGSLRGPDRFNIVEMLKTCDDLLLRYWGHACAWGMSVDLEVLSEVLERFHTHCDQFEAEAKKEKMVTVDTLLHTHELHDQIMNQVLQFGPYGQGNPEPLFQIDEVIITRTETVGRWEKTHLKLHCQKDERRFHVMQRWQGDLAHEIQTNTPQTIVGKVKADTFNGGFYVDGKWIG